MSGTYLAFDLGASSGRAMLAALEGDRVTMREIHRFATPLIERDGHLFWDIEQLGAEIARGLELALEAEPGLRSVSVDSWAVDYVPIDEAGHTLRDPYAYRDPRTRGRFEQAYGMVPPAELYRRTGIQMQEFNTLYQVLADVDDEPEVVERTASRLLIADYLLFRLSGRKVEERTIASTTQLLDLREGGWAMDLIARLGLPQTGWPELVRAGTVLGPIASGVGDGESTPVAIASCSHDTAAAVASVPADPNGPPWAYLSTGTWSLLGIEAREPIATEAAREANFTNEEGLDGSIRFLKNLMGMWILQELEREWRTGGTDLDHAALIADATTAPRPSALVDVRDPRFAARGDMESKLRSHCLERGMSLPESRGELVRLVLESLAADHGNALRQLERLTSQKIGVLHIVGGASRNPLFCQLVADACGCELLAGPVEATALGNVLVQARALGDLPPGRSIRDIVRSNTELRSYLPRPLGEQIVACRDL